MKPHSFDRLAERAAEGLERARKSFDHRRQLVEILAVTGVTTAEDKRRFVDASAVFGSVGERLTITPVSSWTDRHKRQLTVTARLVIG